MPNTENHCGQVALDLLCAVHCREIHLLYVYTSICCMCCILIVGIHVYTCETLIILLLDSVSNYPHPVDMSVWVVCQM